jgi:hypothetical protein
VTQQPRPPGADLIGEVQRWLFRSGARGVSRELGGQFRSAFGRGRSTDVWESATAPPSEEAPECAWCPVCRAARLMGESGPGMASHVAAASDVLASVVQDAMSVLGSAMAAARPPAPSSARSSTSSARSSAPSSARPAARPAARPPAASAARPPAADEPEPPGTDRGVWEEAASPAVPEGPPREPDDRG